MLCKACFRTYLGVFHHIGVFCWGGGVAKELVHSLLMQIFTLDSSKIEVFKTCFSDMVTTQCDHPSYLKHILGRIYMFFTPFGYWVGFFTLGAQKSKFSKPRDRYTSCSCSFSLWIAPKWKFSKLFFFYFDHPI